MRGLNKRYFNWLCSKVYDENSTTRYSRLLEYLHAQDFIFLMDMDENRAYDGVDLRYRFGYEKDIDPEDIKLELDNRPCSVLEMMIALSIRIEEHIMSDYAVGDRTGQWFWTMIVSLGLGSQTDDDFDILIVAHTVSRLLNRTYDPDGRGGLVTIPDCPKDLREVEIWYQLQWYLNYIDEKRW